MRWLVCGATRAGAQPLLRSLANGLLVPVRHSSEIAAGVRDATATAESAKKRVRVWRDGPVRIIEINRPERRNAVCAQTACELADAFGAFEQDADAAVAVLTGANGNFCGGYDLKETALSKGISFQRVGEGNGPMGPTRMMFSKPTIAAVAGYAVAGGLELALLCDLRVVEESATFGVFCRRFGVPLIDGGTVRLQRIVGLGRALDLTLTGRAVQAHEALQMGLATRVVPNGLSLESAIEMAKLIASFPAECMKADRASCYHAAYDSSSLEEALAYEFDRGVPIVSKESIAGARRFAAGAGRGGSFDAR